MNPARLPSTTQRLAPATSNIRGATGLSPAALRAMFAETGLFGRQSALLPSEQAAVYVELDLPAGTLPALASSTDIPDPWRIAAIRGLARSALESGEAARSAAQALAMSFDISAAVRSEVLRTIQTVTLLYGARHRLVRDVTLATVSVEMDSASARFA